MLVAEFTLIRDATFNSGIHRRTKNGFASKNGLPENFQATRGITAEETRDIMI